MRSAKIYEPNATKSIKFGEKNLTYGRCHRGKYTIVCINRSAPLRSAASIRTE